MRWQYVWGGRLLLATCTHVVMGRRNGTDCCVAQTFSWLILAFQGIFQPHRLSLCGFVFFFLFFFLEQWLRTCLFVPVFLVGGGVHTDLGAFQSKGSLEAGPLRSALQQHSESQLEGKQNRKWDLGHGRQERERVREDNLLMTYCLTLRSYIL